MLSLAGAKKLCTCNVFLRCEAEAPGRARYRMWSPHDRYWLIRAVIVSVNLTMGLGE